MIHDPFQYFLPNPYQRQNRNLQQAAVYCVLHLRCCSAAHCHQITALHKRALGENEVLFKNDGGGILKITRACRPTIKTQNNCSILNRPSLFIFPQPLKIFFLLHFKSVYAPRCTSHIYIREYVFYEVVLLLVRFL